MNGLPFENFHHHIENTVHKTKPRGKWHALNAIRSIKRAWDIRELDPEIALFRATVAEEEAASALMLSLKRRGYSNTSLMNWKDHNHKAALQILYNIVVEGFRNRLWPGTQPNIIMESEASDHGFRLEFVLTTKDGEQKKYSLNEPLDFNTNVDGGEDTFAREIQKVLDDNDEQRIEKYIQKWANVRNRLLYKNMEIFSLPFQNPSYFI